MPVKQRRLLDTWDLAIKKESNLHKSNVDSFVERVPKNNSENDGDRHKIDEIFLIDSFVLVITLV